MEFEPLQLIGGFALAILLAGWLIVSFAAPSRNRTIIEWLSASALYGVLLSLFVHLTLRANESDNTIALVAFGFLCTLFTGGVLVSLYHTFASTRGAGDSESSATN